MDVINNLNQELNNIIDNLNGYKPNLFLHVCCGPCSSAVLEKIYNYFNIFIIFYNPNIDTELEFNKRKNELIKLIGLNRYNINIIYDDYFHDEFIDNVKGYEREPECGKRCALCYELRLKNSLFIANKYIKEYKLENDVNYLCSTLSISPHKDSKLLFEIGNKLCIESKSNIKYLPNDFKKENGYLRSIELSKQYNIYRQDYCGCEFAKMNKNT